MDKGCIQESEGESPCGGCWVLALRVGQHLRELGKLSTLRLPRAMGEWLKCPVLGQRELHSPRVLLLAPNPSPAPYLGACSQ